MDRFSRYLKEHKSVMLLLLMTALFIPWLGESLFNTKGEPREAIVAVSMLQSGDWVLPVSMGTDIAYKPPMLAWLIAAFSALLGGEVTEFTSRLPSALAAIALIMSTYLFLRRHRKSEAMAVMTALILATSVEVWRAATACRVDMVLTAAMVGAIYSLYNFFCKPKYWLPWLAILLMSVAFLTKGPVGVILPCLSVGIFRLLRGDRFWPLALRLTAAAILACVLPALWYLAAYRAGGDDFVALVMEENFGRMTGTMSYKSHEAPFYYNFMTVAAGMLPYTLLAVLSLLAVNYSRLKSLSHITLKDTLRRLREADPVNVFAATVTIVIFVFYCIPKSKRSVYLLPIYPFLAWFTALIVLWAVREAPKILKGFFNFISWIGLLVGVAGIAAAIIFDVNIVARIAGVCVSAITLLVAVKSLRTKDIEEKPKRGLSTVVALMMTLSAAVLPPVLSAKSEKYVARWLQPRVEAGELIHSYVDDPLLRHYQANYYLGDRLRRFEIEMPDSGSVLVGARDRKAITDRYGDKYLFETIDSVSPQKSLIVKPKEKNKFLLMKFERLSRHE